MVYEQQVCAYSIWPMGQTRHGYYKFVKAALEQTNQYTIMAKCSGLTYIDDVIEGVIRVIDHPAQPAADFDQIHNLIDQPLHIEFII